MSQSFANCPLPVVYFQLYILWDYCGIILSEKEGLIYGPEEENELVKGLPLFFLNNSTTKGHVLQCISMFTFLNGCKILPDILESSTKKTV